MKTYVPDYWERFRCKAGACRHNCCIGWEIDIDEESLEAYRAAGGAIGKRLRESIGEGEDGNAYFRLTEEERCPFLNDGNLCDLYITLGEGSLCRICTEHPRYYNYIGGRRECGLGLACEKAGELIFAQTEKTKWILLEDDGEAEESTEWEDEILVRRQKVLDILQNREKSTADRTRELFDDVWFGKTPEEWRAFFLGLERMESGWEEKLSRLASENADWRDEDEDENSDTRWEQLLVYFVNRHLADACDAWDFEARLGFAVLSYAVIRTIAEGERMENGSVTQEDLVETARLYSAEIEYSEDNTAAVMDEIQTTP